MIRGGSSFHAESSKRSRAFWIFYFAVLLGSLAAAQTPPGTVSPESLSKTNRLGVELFRQHDFVKATAAFEEDLRRSPEDVEAIIFLGRIAFEENRLADAVRCFERAVSAAPKDSMAHLWLGRAYGIQARDLGPPRGIGPARRARKNLEKAVALDPNNLEARIDLATYYRQAPIIVGGSSRAAIAQAEEIRRRDPYLGALVEGDLAADDKKYGVAERYYRIAIDLQPSKTEAHFRLGLLEQRLRRYDQAFAAFDKVLTLDPKEKPAYFQIGKTADLAGQQLDRGAAALKKYCEEKPFYIMPKLSWAHRRLGNIYLKKGQPHAARQEYLVALELDPADKEASAALKRLGGSDQVGQN